MKKAFLLAASAILLFANTVVAKDVQVKGYTKKDGTKVAGYTKMTQQLKMLARSK